MTLEAGSRLGGYEILGHIGAGGMGEVYRARDPRLGREIAIKVLPAALAADPERRERFEREARAIAALNHPHIVTIHSVEHDTDFHFLTMELVEGTTLADVIPKQGLPLPRLLEIAIAISDAVAAAHDKGVTHRDLKPANVMVRADGRVKLLDFGLAKLRETVPDAGRTELAATQLATGEGKIVGTVAYMSPEQAEGKAVDHRTDIFSLGVILYEMATGERPFKGETSLSVLASIVRDTPASATALRADTPKELAQIIRRALVKDPERRYQSAKDLRNELEDLQREIQSGQSVELPARETAAAVAAKTNRRRGPSGMVLAAVAGAIVLAVAAAAYFGWSGGGSTSTAGPVLMSSQRLTLQQGLEAFPSLSPDGKWLVYSTAGDIYLQSVGGQGVINLTKDSPADDSQPAFSPDGDRIAFVSTREGGGLFLMGRTGESVRRVADTGFNPKWSPDNKEIVYATEPVQGEPHNRNTRTSTLWAVNITTGAKRQIIDTDSVQPSWSPHGTRIAYWRIRIPNRGLGQRDIWTVPAAGGQPTPVTDDAPLDWSPIWSPDGKFLYFSSDRGGSVNLWRVPIDEASGKPLGPPEPVTTPAAFVGHFSFSGDGTRLAFESRVTDANVRKATLDLSTESVRADPVAVTSGSRPWVYVDVSPDGEWLVLAPQFMKEDLYVTKIGTTEVRQITDDADRDRMPRWSPDGKLIAFYSDREDPNYNLWTIRPDSSDKQRVSFSAGGGYYPSWSVDGHRLAGSQAAAAGGALFLMDPTKPWKDQTVQTIPAPPEGFRAWSWTSDGRYILGQFERGTIQGGGLQLFSVESRTFERLRDSGSMPQWLKDDRRFVFFENDKLMLMDVKSKRVKELWSTKGIPIRALSVCRKDDSVYFIPLLTDGDIWMATFGAPK
jgi:eukaryotic-like serine/threonine-protein kinase